MRFIIPFLLVVAVLQPGCAVTQAERKSVIPLESAKPELHGIVYAALGTQLDKPFTVASLEIRPQGQGGRYLNEDLESRPHFHRAYFKYEQNSPSTSTAIVVNNFMDHNKKGAVIAAALPPGDYEIYAFSWSWNNYHAGTDTYFSVPFHVSAGEAIYLGRFIARLTGLEERPLILGLNLDKPDKAYYEVENQYQQDSDLLIQSGKLSSGFKTRDDHLPTCRLAVTACPH